MSFTHEYETVELLTVVSNTFFVSSSVLKERKVASMIKTLKKISRAILVNINKQIRIIMRIKLEGTMK